MSMISGNWSVRCKNRLTGELFTQEISKNEVHNTQAKAEVMVTTNATPYGGKHPGFEVFPEDPDAYAIELAKYLQTHPDWVPPNLDDLTEDEAKELTKGARKVLV